MMPNGVIFGCLINEVNKMTPTQFNIVWICVEHMRYDTLEILNNSEIKTPNLNKLSQSAATFKHAYCQSPLCTPSRSSFLTGRYPRTTTCRQNGQDLPERETLITKRLSNLGWTCGLSGKLHVCAAASGDEKRLDDGYSFYKWSHGNLTPWGGEWENFLRNVHNKSIDDIVEYTGIPLARKISDKKYHQTTWCFDMVLDFLKSQERNNPWLISVNPFAAHDEFDYLDEYMANYNPDEISPPVNDELTTKPECQRKLSEKAAHHYKSNKHGWHMTSELDRTKMKAAYYATIEHLDSEIGRLLEYLENTNQRKNTLIIYHADHGEMLGDHRLFRKGPFMYDPVVRVPLILSMPGTIPERKIYNNFVELIDLVPTIYDLMEVEIPPETQGKSLLPLLRGETYTHRDGVYSEYYNGNPAVNGKRLYLTMWRESNWKIVVHHGDELGELYDLENDPHELKNLWNDSAILNKKMDLMKRCFDASVFTMDPMPERKEPF